MTLLLAMLLDALLGEPKWLWDRVPHPAVLMGKAVAWCDDRYNTGEARKRNGILVVVVLVIGAFAIGTALAAFGPVVEIVLGAILLAQRSLADHVGDVARALRLSVGDGRMMVARIVGRDVKALDRSGVARSAIESAAENLSDGVIAPVFWFAVLGLPGLLAYKVINTADSMIGYRTERHEAFGWAAARLDDVVNWPAARITALLLVMSHWRLDAMGVVFRDAGLHRSPNAGWPEAATAHSLNIALSGPRSYGGEMHDFPYANPNGIRELNADHIDEVIILLWKVWALAFFPAFLIALF